VTRSETRGAVARLSQVIRQFIPVPWLARKMGGEHFSHPFDCLFNRLCQVAALE